MQCNATWKETCKCLQEKKNRNRSGHHIYAVAAPVSKTEEEKRRKNGMNQKNRGYNSTSKQAAMRFERYNGRKNKGMDMKQRAKEVYI
jgi:hypothetical protein